MKRTGKMMAINGETLGMATSVRWTYDVPLKKGDRVRIKEGYHDYLNADCYFYIGKNVETANLVSIAYTEDMAITGEPSRLVLAEAIEPYPYTREERIERVIEDYCDARHVISLADDDHAILFAILDAGV